MVLAELGQTFVNALALSVSEAWTTYQGLRTREPGITGAFTQRTSANILHDLIWKTMMRELDGKHSYTLHDKYPLRFIERTVKDGRTYAIRLKRHRDNAVSSYSTQADRRFYAGGVQRELDGLEKVNLAAGYRWDCELERVECAVISYREGKSDVVWAVEPAVAGVGVAPVLRPQKAMAPQRDLFDFVTPGVLEAGVVR